MANPTGITARLQEIQKRIGEAAVRSDREPQAVTLLAVTKTHPIETLQAAYDAGLRDFGENRVQEALGKIDLLPKDIRWHLLGKLQSNKINKILQRFVLIHSLDSIHTARALAARTGTRPQDVLLEVNTSGEESKGGVPPDVAVETAEKVSALPGLVLKGFMTVGPLTDDVPRQRDSFKALKGLFDSAREKTWAGKDFTTLSMGMSGDFEIAIEEGSNLVRIGTALFGPRG